MDLVLQFRNPGTKLRGVVTIMRSRESNSAEPRILVTSTPAVSVARDPVEPEFYIAKCECFKLAGDGPTALKALEELNHTVRCYLEELLATNCLIAELEGLGWTPVDPPISETELIEELALATRTDEGTFSQIAVRSVVPEAA